MSDQYFANNRKVGDGVTTVWDFSFAGARPDAGDGTKTYLEQSDVRVALVDFDEIGLETRTEIDFSLIGPSQVLIEPAVPDGQDFVIYRETQSSFVISDFVDFASISERDLDDAFRQGLFAVQELRDESSDTRRVSNEARRDTAAALDVITEFTGGGEPLRELVRKSDLAAPVQSGQGALLVRGAVIYVNTIADLQSLDTRGLVDGQQVQVKEYHAGTGVGGGEFYLSLDAQFEHDEGTVFDTQGGQFVRVAGSVVTPLSFGAVSSSTVDSSEEITKFFQCAALTPSGRYIFEFTGDYGTSQTLTLSGFSRKRMAMEATVQALSPLDVVFKFEGCDRSVFTGRLRVRGTGGSSLATNTCVDAIHITGCSRTEFGVLDARNGQGWGVVDTGLGNNMLRIQHIEAIDFGAANLGTRTRSINVTSFARTGGSNSYSQRSVLTVSDPENLPHTIDSYVVIGGFPHLVQSVDVANSTIEVFPWIPTDEEVPGEYGVVYGGGAKIGNQSSAKIEVSTLIPTRCGIGALFTSSSAPNVGRLVSQFNGIGLALGGLHGERTFSGVDISSVYFEAESVAEIMHNSTFATWSNGSSITCSTAVSPSKWYALGSSRGSSGLADNRRYFPVEIMRGNVRWPAQNFRDIATSADGLYRDLSEYTLSLSTHAGYPLHVQGYRGNITINLEDDLDFRRLKGFIPVSAIVTGGGPNGNYTRDTLYVSAQDGYTINGMASPLRLASNPNPFRITAWLTSDTNWQIAIEDLPPPTLFEE